MPAGNPAGEPNDWTREMLRNLGPNAFPFVLPGGSDISTQLQNEKEVEGVAERLKEASPTIKVSDLVLPNGQEIMSQVDYWKGRCAILQANVTDPAVVDNTMVLIDAAAKIAFHNQLPFRSVLTAILEVVRDDSLHKRAKAKK